MLISLRPVSKETQNSLSKQCLDQNLIRGEIKYDLFELKLTI